MFCDLSSRFFSAGLIPYCFNITRSHIFKTKDGGVRDIFTLIERQNSRTTNVRCMQSVQFTPALFLSKSHFLIHFRPFVTIQDGISTIRRARRVSQRMIYWRFARAPRATAEKERDLWACMYVYRERGCLLLLCAFYVSCRNRFSGKAFFLLVSLYYGE